MKKLLTLAAFLAAFAIAHAPAAQANEHDTKVKTEVTTTTATTAAAKELTKEETEACQKDAAAVKEGKTPSKEEEKAAFDACVKAKLEAATSVETPATTDAPKIEEKK